MASTGDEERQPLFTIVDNLIAVKDEIQHVNRPPVTRKYTMEERVAFAKRINALLRQGTEEIVKKRKRQGHGNGGRRAPEYIRVHMEVLVTLKVAAKVPMERYTAVNIERRRAFLEWRSHVNPEDIYFADETGFNFQTDRRNQGRAPEGHVLPQVAFHNSWAKMVGPGNRGL
ncbi:Hypp6152 [Branchiostoma lanceolatum]|uniref:Hypp6152 protein n=1 Tax=Branchiostoma lanceolatum TaxID=7740 RepID=A0A8J9W8X5_BRALA|nr:Hypp6152 [Branchiostoma lanceolatum]